MKNLVHPKKAENQRLDYNPTFQLIAQYAAGGYEVAGTNKRKDEHALTPPQQTTPE